MSNDCRKLALADASPPALGGVVRRYLSKAEIAALLGVSHSTIERRRREGRIESCQPWGKGTRVLYPIDQLDRLRDEAATSARQSTEVDPLTSSDVKPPKPRSGPQPKWKRNHTT